MRAVGDIVDFRLQRCGHSMLWFVFVGGVERIGTQISGLITEVCLGGVQTRFEVAGALIGVDDARLILVSRSVKPS